MKEENKHKIKMDPIMKDVRANFFKSYDRTKFIDAFIADTSKQERAEMAFRFHLAGVKLGDICKKYNISPGYQRELRGLKEKEWSLNMLNDDEEFMCFSGMVKQKYGEIKDDTREYYILCMAYMIYFLIGMPGRTSKDIMKDFDDAFIDKRITGETNYNKTSP